eukprot:CCRYP_003256-RA/>CCRYP_003256-RA protein AED:0.14 eAED:1.00 QI:0/-1/0/1/-1/0/1/0/89
MSSTTRQTMAALPTMPSLTTAPPCNNDSPIVGSIPTPKMSWQREQSETLLKAEGSNCSMPLLGGLKQLTWHCGLMHCGMQCISTTLCLF